MNTVGHLVWDSEAEAPRLIEADPHETAEHAAAAQNWQNRADAALVRRRKDDRVRGAFFSPWFSVIDLARSRGVALWSDDAALRILARSETVPAFSTLAVLQLLTERGLLSSGERQEVDRSLVRGRVGDMPLLSNPRMLLEARRRRTVAARKRRRRARAPGGLGGSLTHDRSDHAAPANGCSQGVEFHASVGLLAHSGDRLCPRRELALRPRGRLLCPGHSRLHIRGGGTSGRRACRGLPASTPRRWLHDYRCARSRGDCRSPDVPGNEPTPAAGNHRTIPPGFRRESQSRRSGRYQQDHPHGCTGCSQYGIADRAAVCTLHQDSVDAPRPAPTVHTQGTGSVISAS